MVSLPPEGRNQTNGREFVCADRFTMADISVAYATFLAVELGLKEQLPERAARHLQSMTSRPAFELAMLTQQKIL